MNCADFQNGSFFSRKPGGNFTTISRSSSIQTERNLENGTIRAARIKWLNDCEYELNYLDETEANQDTLNGYFKNHTLTNRILKTKAGEVNGTNYNYCVFESSIFGISQKITDTLWKHDSTD